MPVSAQLAVLESNLQAYRIHLKSLREAMEALLIASDQILADIETDQRVITILTEQETVNAAAIGVDEPVTVAEVSEAASEQIAEASIEPAVTSTRDDGELAPTAEDIGKEHGPGIANTATLQALAAIASARLAEATASNLATAQGPAETADLGLRASGITAPIGDRKVIDFAKHRAAVRMQPKASRRAAAIAASLTITAGAVTGLSSLMQTELGQRILELGTCDADMVSAYRDCALLAWLLL